MKAGEALVSGAEYLRLFDKFKDIASKLKGDKLANQLSQNNDYIKFWKEAQTTSDTTFWINSQMLQDIKNEVFKSVSEYGQKLLDLKTEEDAVEADMQFTRAMTKFAFRAYECKYYMGLSKKTGDLCQNYYTKALLLLNSFEVAKEESVGDGIQEFEIDDEKYKKVCEDLLKSSEKEFEEILKNELDEFEKSGKHATSIDVLEFLFGIAKDSEKGKINHVSTNGFSTALKDQTRYEAIKKLFEEEERKNKSGDSDLTQDDVLKKIFEKDMHFKEAIKSWERFEDHFQELQSRKQSGSDESEKTNSNESSESKRRKTRDKKTDVESFYENFDAYSTSLSELTKISSNMSNLKNNPEEFVANLELFEEIINEIEDVDHDKTAASTPQGDSKRQTTKTEEVILKLETLIQYLTTVFNIASGSCVVIQNKLKTLKKTDQHLIERFTTTQKRFEEFSEAKKGRDGAGLNMGEWPKSPPSYIFKDVFPEIDPRFEFMGSPSDRDPQNDDFFEFFVNELYRTRGRFDYPNQSAGFTSVKKQIYKESLGLVKASAISAVAATTLSGLVVNIFRWAELDTTISGVNLMVGGYLMMGLVLVIFGILQALNSIKDFFETLPRVYDHLFQKGEEYTPKRMNEIFPESSVKGVDLSPTANSILDYQTIPKFIGKAVFNVSESARTAAINQARRDQIHNDKTLKAVNNLLLKETSKLGSILGAISPIKGLALVTTALTTVAGAFYIGPSGFEMGLVEAKRAIDFLSPLYPGLTKMFKRIRDSLIFSKTELDYSKFILTYLNIGEIRPDLLDEIKENRVSLALKFYKNAEFQQIINTPFKTELSELYHSGWVAKFPFYRIFGTIAGAGSAMVNFILRPRVFIGFYSLHLIMQTPIPSLLMNLPFFGTGGAGPGVETMAMFTICQVFLIALAKGLDAIAKDKIEPKGALVGQLKKSIEITNEEMETNDLLTEINNEKRKKAQEQKEREGKEKGEGEGEVREEGMQKFIDQSIDYTIDSIEAISGILPNVSKKLAPFRRIAGSTIDAVSEYTPGVLNIFMDTFLLNPIRTDPRLAPLLSLMPSALKDRMGASLVFKTSFDKVWEIFNSYGGYNRPTQIYGNVKKTSKRCGRAALMLAFSSYIIRCIQGATQVAMYYGIVRFAYEMYMMGNSYTDFQNSLGLTTLMVYGVPAALDSSGTFALLQTLSSFGKNVGVRGVQKLFNVYQNLSSATRYLPYGRRSQMDEKADKIAKESNNIMNADKALLAESMKFVGNAKYQKESLFFQFTEEVGPKQEIVNQPDDTTEIEVDDVYENDEGIFSEQLVKFCSKKANGGNANRTLALDTYDSEYSAFAFGFFKNKKMEDFNVNAHQNFQKNDNVQKSESKRFTRSMLFRKGTPRNDFVDKKTDADAVNVMQEKTEMDLVHSFAWKFLNLIFPCTPEILSYFKIKPVFIKSKNGDGVDIVLMGFVYIPFSKSQKPLDNHFRKFEDLTQENKKGITQFLNNTVDIMVIFPSVSVLLQMIYSRWAAQTGSKIMENKLEFINPTRTEGLENIYKMDKNEYEEFGSIIKNLEGDGKIGMYTAWFDTFNSSDDAKNNFKLTTNVNILNNLKPFIYFVLLK